MNSSQVLRSSARSSSSLCAHTGLAGSTRRFFCGFRPHSHSTSTQRSQCSRTKFSSTPIRAKQAQDKDDAQSTTEKWGLEAGLFKVFSNKQTDGKSKGQQAKELVTRYGSAYLITSISLALVSFTLCYALINSGVDVPALLARFGLQPSDTSEKVGTFAIAYAAHKALSPVRFPPTVALTPVVAKLIGKQPKESDAPQDL